MLPADTPEYGDWLRTLKQRIEVAQSRAAVSVNRELVLLYWHIGREILEKQSAAGWGAKVIDRLAADLTSSFPGVNGFSSRNLKYMRRFAEAWPDSTIVQEALAQLSWYQHIALLEKLPAPELREWYARASISHGWSRAVLVHQIETKLHERHGKAVTNFSSTMTPDRATAAAELFKDPYVLDFIDLAPDVHERHLDKALIDRIREFLLELGKGFSFVGSQYHLEVGGQDFYLDLLFYHTKLHSYVVIDLKMQDFEPEFAGKMAFYLTAVDKLVATEGDNPSIGLILCQGKNGLIVEYALRDVNKPLAVAEYRVLPQTLQEYLPTVEDLVTSLNPPDQEDSDDHDGGVGGGP